MTDNDYRGLLTDREKEILASNADVTDQYRYRVISRVRTKIEALDQDHQFLQSHHPDLADELTSTICEPTNSSP